MIGVFVALTAVSAVNDDIYVVKASGCPGLSPSKERVLSGFAVREFSGVITALHGVALCESIVAYRPGSVPPVHSWHIDRVDLKRDVALLSTTGVSLDPVLRTARAMPSGKYEVQGFPLSLANQVLKTVIEVADDKVPLRFLVPSDEQSLLALRGSPELEVPVYAVRGPLTIGHSGAPVLRSNQVHAVVIGGLLNGAAEITWAVPLADLELKSGVDLRAESLRLDETHQLLLSYARSSDGERDSKCFGRVFTHTRTVTAGQLETLVDDRRSFQDLADIFQVSALKPATFGLFLSDDGEILIAVPDGWELRSNGSSRCEARSQSGNRVTYELEPLNSNSPRYAQAQGRALRWENREFCLQGFIRDISTSNILARPDYERRVVARRQSFVHIPNLVCRSPTGLVAPLAGTPSCACPFGYAAQAPPGTIADRVGFSSLMYSHDHILISWVRFPAPPTEQVNRCLVELVDDASCKELEDTQFEYATGVLAATASGLNGRVQ